MSTVEPQAPGPSSSGPVSTDADFGRRLTRGHVRIEWDALGEGWHGDYNPEDPDDTELLRFTVYRFDGDDVLLASATADPDLADLLAHEGLGWVEVEDASYCTQVPVDTDPAERQRLLEVLMGEFHDLVSHRTSVKKLGERLSWVAPATAQVAPGAT